MFRRQVQHRFQAPVSRTAVANPKRPDVLTSKRNTLCTTLVYWKIPSSSIQYCRRVTVAPVACCADLKGARPGGCHSRNFRPGRQCNQSHEARAIAAHLLRHEGGQLHVGLLRQRVQHWRHAGEEVPDGAHEVAAALACTPFFTAVRQMCRWVFCSGWLQIH